MLLFTHSAVSDSLWPPWTATHQASLSFTISWSLLKLMSVESMMPSNHQPPLLLPSIFPSIKVISNELALHIRWPKYWSFSFSISPSNNYSGLVSFRIDWFDLLAVQGTLKSLLQLSICEMTQEMCIRYYYLGTLAEDLREGSVPERPCRVLFLLSNILTVFHYLIFYACIGFPILLNNNGGGAVIKYWNN